MTQDSTTVESVRGFLRARAMAVRLCLEPLPWQEARGCWLAGTLPNTGIRILVDPGSTAPEPAVSLLPPRPGDGHTDVVLRPAAGEAAMLAGWTRLLAVAAILDASQTA